MKNSSNQEAMSRRSALRYMSVVVAGGFVGLSTAQASDSTTDSRPKRPKPVWDSGETSPRAVLQDSRFRMGLEEQSDITSEISSDKRRIGDTVVEGMASEQLEFEKKYFENYLPSVVARLMDTDAYSHQAQVDMKFGVIRVTNVVSNTFQSFRDGSIAAGEARLKLRTGIFNYLDYLEQLPHA